MCVVARLLLNLEGNEGYGHDWHVFYGVIRMGTERKLCRICRENLPIKYGTCVRWPLDFRCYSRDALICHLANQRNIQILDVEHDPVNGFVSGPFPLSSPSPSPPHPPPPQDSSE